ncbi:MAG TPA: nucleotidyl transferase AbiEii/AbiGii toxin family protein [Candidatus Acidoferrales bacterium]
MNTEQRLQVLRSRGYSAERAEALVLLREAAVVLFSAFPDSFVIFGGANLILFHGSMRHSADLDLLSTGAEMPDSRQMAAVLEAGLKPLCQLWGFEGPKVQITVSDESLKKILVSKSDGTALFTVDLTRMGTILAGEIEEHTFESASSSTTVTIKAASRDLLLLQKAEAFIRRRAVKVRDAYDAKLLVDGGAALGSGLQQHLDDDLRWEEFGAEQIRERIAQIDARRCQAELANVLPEKVFNELREKDFQPLRDVFLRIFSGRLKGEFQS